MNKMFEQEMSKKDLALLKVLLPKMSNDAAVGCDVRICRPDRNRLKIIFSIMDLPRHVTSVFYVKLDQLSASAFARKVLLDMDFEHFAINNIESSPTRRQQKALAKYLIMLEQEYLSRKPKVS